jgi:hypothetical protein
MCFVCLFMFLMSLQKFRIIYVVHQCIANKTIVIALFIPTWSIPSLFVYCNVQCCVISIIGSAMFPLFHQLLMLINHFMTFWKYYCSNLHFPTNNLKFLWRQWGPRSRVCALLTLRVALHQHQQYSLHFRRF